MNKCIFMGRITHDLEVKQVAIKGEQTSVLNFSIAVNGANNTTDFIDCVAWRGAADAIGKYLHKGSRILVEGALKTRTYDVEKDGVTMKRKVCEVNVDRFEFCDSKDSDQKPAQAAPQANTNHSYDIATNNFEPANYAPTGAAEDMF